jgi:hypothetical protein
MRRLILFLLGISLLVLFLFGQSARTAEKVLPRFTEEREAAALFFVKKHSPDLLPLLDDLKKKNPQQYRQEIRHIFQVTEWLADLQADDEKRYELEMKIWKTENQANALVARLALAPAEEHKKIEKDLLRLARELEDLDVRVLDLKAERLEQELGAVKDEAALARENLDRNTHSRYEKLREAAGKPKK